MMMPYIAHVSIIIAVCFLFYKIFLQKETFFTINRWVLITCLIVSFSLPFLPVPEKWSLRNTIERTVPPVSFLSAKENSASPSIEKSASKVTADPVVTIPSAQTAGSSTSWVDWIYYLYITGLIIFGANLLFQLVTLLYQSYTKEVVQDGPFRIVETTGDKAPCSFGNTIFINPSRYDWETYNQILLHEKIHCRQKHSVDIFFAELVLVFQWFNPFAWLYRKQVENNLEFLTDDSMINKNGIERSGYQMSLLKVSVPHLPLGITTNYNQSLLKKRIAMMNVKKSSIQTTWKYFFLIPLLTCLVCALNQPVAIAQSGTTVINDTRDNAIDHNNVSGERATEGVWIGTIKKERIDFTFKSEKDDHNWNSNTSFLKSEFPSLPTQAKGDFQLKRDAGTILFNGKFDGDIGYGHYSFKEDETFKTAMKQYGITNVNKEDMFTFFMVNVSKDYVNVMQRNGFKDLSKDNLIAMAAMKVDEPFIRFWKKLGYTNVSADNLISSKALGIDSAYIQELQKAGIKDLSIDNLTAFKSMGITSDYILQIKKMKNDGDNLPSNEDIIAFKSMDISPAYIKSLADVGYGDIPYEKLTAFKSLGINADFIKGFEAIGYKKIPFDELVSLKSLGVNAEFIKSFEAIGYKNMPVDNLVTLKSMGVKPEFIKGFKNIGFANITIDEAVTMKSMNITPEYIVSMRKKGFDSKDINKYVELKSSFKDVQ